MARRRIKSDEWTVPAGPGWAEATGAYDDSLDVAVNVTETRFGPATIAAITLGSDGDPFLAVSAELTLGDTLAVIKRLEGIARQAILDGYFDANPESIPDTGLDKAEPFDSFEVAMCGEVIDRFDPAKSFIERLTGDEDLSEYDRTFWTVYGYRKHPTEDDIPDAGHLSYDEINREIGKLEMAGEYGARALIDVESEDEALRFARWLADDQPVEVHYDGMIVNKALKA